ncbi:type VII secretion target [Nocardia blacklockiae]|uniref:type VII secretion target n=1 Tax=Nocardia blacklockiae TaxID=480036 RepID=UPI0018953E4B|nr:type VII secretion target [Nocardia blacklockiae]MBF6175653.1 hypothetical protein [Nocardia blacklockiae]
MSTSVLGKDLNDMPDNVNVDPELLRLLAQKHDGIADDTRKWAEPPSDWLAAFPETYGKIAHPVHQALMRYYTARERAGNALADEHQYTANSLREAALAYEQADQDSGHGIKISGDEFGGSPSTQTPTGPAGPGSTPPSAPDAGPAGGPPPAGPSTTGAGPGGAGPNGAGPNGAGPQDPGAGPDSGRQTPAVAGPDGGGPGGGPGGPGAGPGTNGAASTGTTATPLGAIPPGGPGGGPGGPGASGPFDDRTSAQTSGSRFDGPPIPVVTPFAAAVAKAKDEAAEPAYVVGDAVDEDLVLAKTLLGGVLAAADTSAIGLHWAVAVLRGPAGLGVFITSNEGRGWLPAGVFMPQEVSTPWSWDEVLSEGGEAGSPWEGVSDPARILVEFGLAWGPKAGAKLTALASSAPLDSGMRNRFADVPMEGLVGPTYDVDLRVFTADTADRLGLTGSPAALQKVASVPDNRVRATCMELAADAHAQVGRAGPVPPEAAAGRDVRQRILTALEGGREVPSAWWEELRDADDLLAAAMLSRRVDVGRVEPGELRVDDNPALRAMVFERRCNELALLLADAETTRQHLRDAVYAHVQITEHPQFVLTPAAVSTAETERAAVPSAAPSGVSAPVGQVSGPPAGVSVPPVASAPPVAPPSVAPPPVSPPPGAQGQS